MMRRENVPDAELLYVHFAERGRSDTACSDELESFLVAVLVALHPGNRCRVVRDAARPISLKPIVNIGDLRNDAA